jgi:hypothetical protein
MDLLLKSTAVPDRDHEAHGESFHEQLFVFGT